MENCVRFVDYDKITDTIAWLSRDVTLEFSVLLAKKGKDGKRYHFHKEFKYDSRYVNKGKTYSIKRDFDYYLNIKVRDNFDASIMIRAKDMIALRQRLHIIYKWLTNGKLFKYDNEGKLIIVGKPTPIDLPNLSGKFIRFTPIVITYDDEYEKETQKPGVRIFLNGDYPVDINIDSFMELLYFIDGFEMYQCALAIVDYLGKPDYPVNLYEVESNPYDELDKPRIKMDSYFDKVK